MNKKKLEIIINAFLFEVNALSIPFSIFRMKSLVLWFEKKAKNANNSKKESKQYK